jgi:hypothetical protein
MPALQGIRFEFGHAVKHVGEVDQLEAGPLSQWLVNALTAAELPVTDPRLVFDRH